MDKYSLRDASLPQPLQSDSRRKQFWDGINSQLSSPPAAAAPKRDLDTEWSDYPKAVGAGALELVGGIGELARQASNFGKENAGKQGGDYLEQARANMANKLSPLLDVVAGAGDLAASGAESLNDGMSADAKEALGRRLVDETPEGRLTLGDGAGDIDVWAMKMAQGVGSLLPTLAAGGVTGVAAKASIGRAVTASMVKRGATQEVAEAVAAKAVSKIATGASVTTGVTGSVGSAGVNTRDTVLGMSFDELSRSDTFRQAFTRIDQDQQTQHLSDEEKLSLAREETANVASRATMSDAKVWGAAAVGSMMGDAMLFKMLAGKAATGGVLKGAAKGAAGEWTGETLENGVQQYAINESLNKVAAADIDPMKGVVSSALEGGLIGIGTGGAVGAVGGARGGKHASQEDGVGTDPVSEPSAPVTEGAAGPAVDPNFASVPLEEGEQAPSASQAEGELNPLGPSASQFDELRDVPAYLRQDDTADRYKGMAADSEVQRALAGEFGQTVQELVASQMKAGDQGKSLYERAQAGELGLDPFAGNKSAQQVAMENQRLALPLNGGGFGVAAIGEVQQAQAQQGGVKQPSSNSAQQDRQDGKTEIAQNGMVIVHGSGNPGMSEQDIQIVRASGQKQGKKGRVYGGFYGTSEQDAHQAQAYADMMGGTPTLYDVKIKPGTKVLHKQGDITRLSESYINELVSQGYGVVTGTDPRGQTEHVVIDKSAVASMAPRGAQATPSQVNDTNVADIRQPSDQPAASVSAETVPAPSATAGEASQLAPAIDTGYREVIPVKQPKTEVSNEPVTPVPAISSEGQRDQPGAGEPAAAGAGPAVAGLTDRAGSGDRADLAAPAPVPDGQQQNDPTLTAPATDAGAAVSGRIGEEELRDRDLLKEHGGHWKYRSAVGAGWFTANTKEAAIERAEEAYRKAVSKGIPAPTRAERWAKEEQEFAERMDGRFGKMTIPELEERHRKLGGTIADLQQAGRNEMNGNGGRRTGAAVASEGARQSGQEKMELERYIQLRRDRDTTGSGVKSQQIEAARAEVAPDPTDAQKEAGNYKKGHLKLQGLDIALENPKGSTRSGTDKDGKAWQSTMAHDYGYIKRTLGADGDHVDVFIGDRPDSETVYVVDQVDPKTGKFDEHKVMMGFADEQAAREGYLGNYEAGWKGLGAIKAMPVESFKRWVKGGDTMSPIAAQPVAGTVNSVRFSKQAMAQGDKPIKHLTRKEAELVSRGWFKQYRGASGVKVQIHATQGELEGALGLEAKEGLIRRAAFDDDAGTLHVAADTISDPKRMREILRHEVLAHYGLANVLGDGEYTKLMSRLIQSQKDPSMKPVWDWVNTHYADEDIGTKAEEVVAHLAELEQGAWGRGWDRVVAWVTRALRAVGFVPDGITAAETRSLIEGLGKQLQRTGQDDGGSGGKKFSQEEKPGEDTFKPYPGEAEEYRRQLGKMMASPKSGELVIEMGRTPLVLQAVGAPDLPLRITRDIVRKATNGVKHDVPMPVIEQLPELLHDPIAVFDSKTEQGAKTILIDARDASGRPIITAVHLNAKAGRIDINRIASVYGKDNGIGAMERWIDEGLLRYAREKQNPLGTTQGLQLPKRGSPERVYDSNILTKDDIRKGGIKMSQASTAADAAMEKLNLGPKPDIIDKTKASLNKLRQVDRGVVSSWIDRVIKKANTEVLDALAPIKYAEEAAGITDAADSGYVAARMATGAASTMQATMLYGLPEWNDGVIQRKAGTGEKDALLGIFADLGADLHNWLGWMAGHRAELLMAQGRENLLDANDIAALKGQGNGKEAKFLDAKARWNRLNAATLDLAQEAGLFTKEARAEFESEWYIPFFRESDDGDVIAPFKTKGIANQNAGIKKLKGGEANTNDLLENIFTSTSKLIDASMKNMAAQKTVWNLADTGIIEVIPKPNKMDYQALANGKDRIMVKLEGEDYMIRVEDPDLYRAMTFFDREPFGAMVNVAAKAKRILTAGITASPEFMLRNFLRDSLSSWAISKDGFKPMIDSIKGVRKTWRMDGSTIDVMFSGASFLGGYVNGNDPEAMADTVRKSLRRKGMTPEQIARYEKSIIRNAAHAKGVVADAWEKYSRVGEAVENGNREAVYDAAIKAGKSHAQAAFESKDLMDFSMLGASRTMQVMTQLLPFFNARVQGLGKLTRELRDNPRAIAKRAGMITAASLALLAANWDDERYEELPDWDKDANWHFFVGDQHFRIPKPFEIGVLFGTIPERMVRAMGDKDTGAQFGKAVARAIGDTFALNPTPQIVKPLVEAAFNYDTFRGGPIDGPQDLNVQAEARYNEQTSLLMRELGELTGFSPKQLEHLVIGYTGTMGSYVMAAADGLIRASRPGESASWRADEIPLVKAVYRGSGPAKSTQHMEEFYRMLNEVNQLKRTVDQYRSEGLTDKARELLEEQGGILKSRRSLSRTQQQVRVVRNRIELIQRDRTLTAEEKRRRIDEMLARRNDLVYQAVNKNKANWE
ncbi:LPD38 domain-containing protein [Aeromonas caviae]|uniref:LPD38 domain-containing protein n=1 Tax=Aeromonas caviae TaxID=648 RepID=UPI002B24E0E2|nr:LPD38 domain-containing protein [Aeromonas caviae]MEA9441470.1 LPD38 domain-containing protein [Aeromonas caviae]